LPADPTAAVVLVVLAAGIWWGYGIVLLLTSALAGERTLRLAAT
jgi:hypothetical protein